ncbi:MAG: DegT/DnrJ/EryC1/StrS family aminotransferase [bacterium]
MFIPVCEPTLAGNERKYIADCLESGWISSAGKYIEEFEKQFSSYCGCRFGVACTSGTAALHLALAAACITDGDEVIIPAFTMIASCNAVIYTGATPVLVDSELKTWNMDTALIEQKITERTRAVMPVHTYGHPVDMQPLFELAEKYNLLIIEDAAEAHGAEYHGRKAGSLGNAACFSFYANKIITTGEGGMVVTSDEQLAERARLLRNHAFTEPRFFHHHIGFNYRMTNLQAAIGLAQLEKIDELVDARRRNAEYYTTLLSEIDGIVTPPQAHWAKNVFWMFGILVEESFGITARQLAEELRTRGVDTRAFFLPMHRQPVFQNHSKKNYPDVSGNYPAADALYQKGLYLPSSSHLRRDQIEFIVEQIGSLKR